MEIAYATNKDYKGKRSMKDKWSVWELAKLSPEKFVKVVSSPNFKIKPLRGMPIQKERTNG